MSKRIALNPEERGESVLRLLRQETTAVDLARHLSTNWPLRPSERKDPLMPADVYEVGLAVILPCGRDGRAPLRILEEASREPKAA